MNCIGFGKNKTKYTNDILKMENRYIFALAETPFRIQKVRIETNANTKNVHDEKGNMLLNSNIRIVGKQSQFSILIFQF
jgi:pyrrolidone-carboxylate peptidase